MLCLLALSIPIDAAKKKLLKKLAKELGYKLDEAIEELQAYHEGGIFLKNQNPKQELFKFLLSSRLSCTFLSTYAFCIIIFTGACDGMNYLLLNDPTRNMNYATPEEQSKTCLNFQIQTYVCTNSKISSISSIWSIL